VHLCYQSRLQIELVCVKKGFHGRELTSAHIFMYVVGTSRCRDTLQYFDEGPSCFVFYSIPLSWYNARNRCIKLGGDLASIISADSNVGLTKLATSPHWIGLRSSWWTWLDGCQCDLAVINLSIHHSRSGVIGQYFCARESVYFRLHRIECMRCRLLLPMIAVSVSLSITRLNSASLCRGHSVQLLPNHFGLLFLFVIR